MSKLVAYVLSGRNAGAQLYLDSGSYSFGSSNQAYFTFDDSTLKDLHFEIEIVSQTSDQSPDNLQEFSLFVLPLEGKVKVNSKAISQKVAINVGDLISFAFNEIMLAHDNADINDLLMQAEEIKHQEYQERVDSAVAQAKESMQQQLQEQYDTKLIEATKEAQEQAKASLLNNKAQESSKSSLNEQGDKDTKVIFHDKKVSLFLWLATALGALILALLIYLLVFASSASSPIDNENIVSEYLKSNYVENITFNRDQGYLQVSGLVSTNEQRDKVLANLPHIEEVLVINLKSYQTIIEDVQRAFALRGAVVRVERTTDNHLHVFGYIQNSLIEANLLASIRDILANDALLNFASLSTSPVASNNKQGSIINPGLVLETHFMYERSLNQILKSLNNKHKLKMNYLFAPFDIAYVSDAMMETNPRFIALIDELNNLINAPVSLLDSSSMSYKYSMLKQRLATGKGLVFGENDRIAKRLSDTALGADQSALLDYYQQALDKASPYQKRIKEQSLANMYQSQINELNKKGTGLNLSDLLGAQSKTNKAQANESRGLASYGSTKDSHQVLSEILAKINKDIPLDNTRDMQKSSGNIQATDNIKPSLNAQASGSKKTSDNIKSDDYGLDSADGYLLNNYENTQELNVDNIVALDVMGVTMKPLRFISMRDGSKIFEGGMTSNGYIVKEIRVNQLVLIDASGKEIIYELK